MFATEYRGPTTTDTLPFGDHTLRIVRPADPESLLDDPEVLELNRRTDYMPYWGFLWPGAYLLAEAVLREPWAGGLNALELGCGLGLAGLAGLVKGLRVEFTDYDAAPFRFVEQSAAANGIVRDRFRCSLYDWQEPQGPKVPVILGADVLYEKRLIPLVCGVIRERLEPDGVALVAGPYRVATEDLGQRLREFGLTTQSEPITTKDRQGAPLRGILQRIRRVTTDSTATSR